MLFSMILMVILIVLHKQKHRLTKYAIRTSTNHWNRVAMNMIDEFRHLIERRRSDMQGIHMTQAGIRLRNLNDAARFMELRSHEEDIESQSIPRNQRPTLSEERAQLGKTTGAVPKTSIFKSKDDQKKKRDEQEAFGATTNYPRIDDIGLQELGWSNRMLQEEMHYATD